MQWDPTRPRGQTGPGLGNPTCAARLLRHSKQLRGTGLPIKTGSISSKAGARSYETANRSARISQAQIKNHQ